MSSTVVRAIEILELISDKPERVSDIARHLDVHRSTALRLLQPLVDGGLARRLGDGSYGIGYRITGLAQRAIEQFDLTAISHHRLQSLSQIDSYTVHMGLLDGDKVLYVDKVEPPKSVRLYSQIGQAIRLHTAGLSKAILAFQPQARVDALLKDYEFTPFTETTITSRDAFLAELADVRKRGWAIDDGEFEDYINCIAAPIRNMQNEVVAAVSVTALKARTDLTQLQELLPDLLETCRTISLEWGWRP